MTAFINSDIQMTLSSQLSKKGSVLIGPLIVVRDKFKKRLLPHLSNLIWMVMDKLWLVNHYSGVVLQASISSTSTMSWIHYYVMVDMGTCWNWAIIYIYKIWHMNAMIAAGLPVCQKHVPLTLSFLSSFRHKMTDSKAELWGELWATQAQQHLQ